VHQPSISPEIASGLTASRRQRDGISGRLPADPAPTLITWRSAALTATSAWLPRVVKVAVKGQDPAACRNHSVADTGS
jgi:hypothetical protein